jgi:glycine betaine/proline transport system ATP-binding protein
MPKIEARNVTTIFGDQPEKALALVREGASKDEILDRTGQVVGVLDASFSVEAGEIFVVMGLSGSGKSTLVRCINRLVDPTGGTIEIDGVDVTSLSERELRHLRSTKLSMVFQRFALFPHQTVRDNAAFGLEVQGVSKAERRRRADEALEMVGLGSWGDRYPAELSGGMQQRVGLARALATDADILLMDEAFSALDPLIRREMQDHLLQLQEELQKTIVFITHDLNEAMRLGDRIAVMKDGAIVQIGTAEDILTRPATDYVAAFIQDVDPTRVLTAGSVMRDPVGVVSPEVGPRVAMQRLRELQRNELYAVRPDRTLVGYVRDADLAEAAARGERDLTGVVRTDYPSAGPETLISDLYGLAVESTLPIAVVDERTRLLGVVPRVSLLNALAELAARSAEAAEHEAAARQSVSGDDESATETETTAGMTEPTLGQSAEGTSDAVRSAH